MLFLEIEAGLVLLGFALALLVPNLGSRWFGAWERRFGKLAERRGLSVVVVGLMALALRAVLLPILPIPQPLIQDEYGYLLLSDTFAHGRLTNPTNPMWHHFENLFIIWQPTYTAKYWPAQGLVMAFGQVVTGHPFWGVWLSVGLMCAAITWMLQGWLDPGWALLGGFLAVIRLGTFSYWANSYWGGAVAALGGALVLGALPRLKQERRARHALLMGLGFAVLANSRPYEGIFFGIPVAVALVVWLWKMKRPDLGAALKRAVAPLLIVLALTVVAMGYYFWRTTGSPFNTPYFVYAHTYDAVPSFPWQPLKPVPVYRHRIFQEYNQHLALPDYTQTRTAGGFLVIKAIFGFCFWAFYLGPVLTFPFLLAWAILPYGFSLRDFSPEARFLLVVCGVMIVGEALPIYFLPHYAAPITCVILALVLMALRRVRPWRWRGKPTGLFVTRTVPSICLLLFFLRAGVGITHWLPVGQWPAGIPPTWCAINPVNLNRAAVLAMLRQYPGRQLVIVHHKSSYDESIFFNEWVYNRADLNSAKVIWAQDMGPAKNEELIRYFKNRRAWLVDADDDPPKLLPYPEPGPQAEKSASSPQKK